MQSTFRTTSDGRKVWVSGQVVIEEVLHRIHGGYVACNTSLNHRPWNTTPQKQKCLLCFPNTRGMQLNLFEK